MMDDQHVPNDVQQRVWREMEDTGERPCPHCQDLGLLSPDVPVGHTLFGKVIRCVCQKHVMPRHIEAMLKAASDMTADDCYRWNFSDMERLPYAQLAVNYARQMAAGGPVEDGNGDTRPGLLLIGSYGSGKTTLASIVFRLIVEAGEPVLWVDYLGFIKAVQGTYGRADGPAANDLIDPVRKVNWLFIDDLGNPSLSERGVGESLNRIEIVTQILNYRDLNHLPTLITTNLSEQGIEDQFDGRVASRLLGLCHVAEMRGPDLRRAAHRQYGGME